MWRVDTPAVRRSLGGGGCGATAAASLVGMFESTPEAGVCFAGSGVCGSGRVTGEAKGTLARLLRVDPLAAGVSLLRPLVIYSMLYTTTSVGKTTE